MNLLLILVTGTLMHAARSFSTGENVGGAGTSLAFGYVLLTAFFAGSQFKVLRLPKITGYLMAGIVIGPSVLGLLTTQMVDNLKVVNGMAIGLIALTAGTELELRVMRPALKAIQWIAFVAIFGTSLLLTAIIWLTRDLLPFMTGLSTVQSLAVALVLSVVMSAQSPAVVIALRDEMHADGPVSRTVLGAVVIGDLVVILLFAAVSTIAKSALGATADVAVVISTLAWEIIGSLVGGSVVGVVLAVYLRKVKGGASLFLLAVTFVVAEVGQRLHFDPLLVALAAGITVRNATSLGDALHDEIHASAMPVYVVFFAVAGANLPLEVLALVGLPALFYVGMRGLGLFFGARIGATLAGAPAVVKRYAGFGLLPQSGLALALALLFAKMFPELGTQANALLLGVVAINEMLAPTLYRMALVRSGEAERLIEEQEPAPSPNDPASLLSELPPADLRG
jgi:Kef-type K+ transport system membrane component KefB